MGKMKWRARKFPAWPATRGTSLKGAHRLVNRASVNFTYLRNPQLMIEVSQLTKRYAGHEAVRDISFSVARGEIVGFLGPNGAGKTTTLRMLTGYLPQIGRAHV